MNNSNIIQSTNFRIVILSDTHGTIHHQVLNQINETDYVIHSGDILDYQIIDNLEKLSNKVFAVNGNNDQYENLNLTETIKSSIGDIVVTHGHNNYPNYHESLRKEHNNASVIIYGHTHRHIIDTSSKPYVINPGAAGKVRTQGGSSCVVLKNLNNNLSLELLKFEYD